MRKMFILLTVCALLCGMFATTISAAEYPIMPLYNNTQNVDTKFEISSDGTATVLIKYYDAILWPRAIF